MMSKSMTYTAAFTAAFAFLCGAAAMPMGGTASAQTANNVICKKCVGATDLGKFAVTKAKIAKKAVTTSRIAPGAVKTSRIGNGQVSTAKLAPGAVTASRIGAGAVTASGIADGAVRTTHIGNGQVVTAKIADGAVTFANLAEDAVFTRTVVVNPVGPTAADNCDALQTALAGITDASAAKPYAVHLEPGIYDCGSSPVVMTSFVDLAGSGRNATHIKGGAMNGIGLVQMAANTQLRDLSVTNTLSGESATNAGIGISSSGTGIRVSNVSATGAGSSATNIGIMLPSGFSCGSGCRRTLVDVEATGDGGAFTFGIFIGQPGSNLTISNTVAAGMNAASNNSGLFSRQSTVLAQGSRLVGAQNTVALQNGGAVRVVHSQLAGGVVIGVGTFACFGVYDENLVGLGATCQ